LAMAWGGTALLISPVAEFAGDPESIIAKCLGQATLWLLFAAVLVIVLYWEKKPFASLWLKPFQWQSAAWAGLLVFMSVFFLFPATEWIRKGLGMPGYEAGMEKAIALPVWFRAVAVVTAGVVEETLFRSYAVTRLTVFLGNVWAAATLSVLVFAALHMPVWGAGPALAFFVGGMATTAFFIWRRDLLAMILAHIAIDAWALIVAPHYSVWWR